MRLYIAEKPSMGREIAKCLKNCQRENKGYIVTDEGVVTWLFGHILRQAEPNEYDPRYKKWNIDDLPIVPQKWKLVVQESAAGQFNLVKNLIDRADEIVHAGDPDREGQLLVDEVLDFLGNKKPVKRILLNALDEESIRDALASPRDNRDFLHLKESALARSRADWLIGMNLSRAYTLTARRSGLDVTFPVGRVKTPTLALVVRREREITNFKPIPYYRIRGEFAHPNGSFVALWKPREDEPGLDSEGRMTDKEKAEAKLAFFAKEPRDAKVSDYRKSRKKEPPPLPFALSTLQVLAGKMYGYDPQLVLDTAQKLYEKKLTTYPRSDCEYLPENQIGDAPRIFSNLASETGSDLALWAKKADAKIKSRAWNDKKISAHHAIIPTKVQAHAEKLDPVEKNIYFLIARGYIAQFYPLYEYDQVKAVLEYKKELFEVSGRRIVKQGWKEMYLSTPKEEDASVEETTFLPPMKKNDPLTYEKGTLDKKVTKPPPRFTPSTLLLAMKEIGKYVKDPEKKKQLKEVCGIGTEATRASIIDDLIRRKFLTPQGKKKQLLPEESAYILVDALPDEMTYPDSTAIWEERLHSMTEGIGTLEEFLSGQITFTSRLCQKAAQTKIKTEGVVPCPACNHGVLKKRQGKNGDFWGCSNFPKCRFSCNDKEGQPDLAGSRRRSFSGGNTQSFGSASSPTYYGEDFGAPVYPTEEEMAEYYANNNYTSR